ncbi:MAG: NifB/NifX family molybdenum-iron cluster-binding protein [Chitinivibrionales bacterium]|nr:NifB/NifX family molybdenum-iron cluster-binding protein [Chitinivibrionales bacterium]
MKICMPVLDDSGMDSVVFGHFGSAPFFALYDTETQGVTIVKNALGEHEHGQCMPVDAIRKTGAEAVLCKGMGMRAANLLLGAGITPYRVDAATVSEAVACYTAKNMTLLDARNACQGHDCH